MKTKLNFFNRLSFHIFCLLSFSTISLNAQTYTFTNCGATGRFGPLQAQVNATYTAGNTLFGAVSIVTQGIQQWTVPSTGTYKITVAGAGGGSSTAVGGRGKYLSGEIVLTAGTVLKIIVGQKGSVSTSSGGGGGSFVVNQAGNTPIIIAGGGGGYLNSNVSVLPNSDANFTNGGKNSLCNTGTGGLGGNGGNGSNNGWGCGGGGFSSNGTEAANSLAWGYAGKGLSFLNGSTGGASATAAVGGFGGGGGTHGSTGGGGGGGGYSGGGGSNQNISPNVGGGGGSYVNLTMTNVADLGFNQNIGFVIITFSSLGNALNFDGTNDYLLVPDATINNLASGTVESWIYLNSNNEEVICVKQHDGVNTMANFSIGCYSSTGGLYTAGVAGKIYFHAQNNGVNEVASITNLNTGNWYHVAVTFNNTSANIYINGILDNTAAGNYTVPNDLASTATTLGGWLGGGGGRYFNGSMDEFRIWNTVRTQAQIKTDMYSYITSAHAQWVNLKAYYRFDQGNAGADNTNLVNEAIDYSGNCNKGTLTNMTRNGVTSNWVHPGNLEAPVLTTIAASGISYNTVILNGNIFSIGETNVTTRGFQYATDACLTSNLVAVSETGIYADGAFSLSPSSNLGSNTTYYYRAFATNTQGTSYGEVQSFTTGVFTPIGNALDFDGTNDYVDCGNILAPSYTKEAWIYISNMTLGDNFISGGNADGRHAFFAPTAYGNKLSAGHNGVWNSVQDPVALVVNTWYHVAVTYDAPTTTMKLYKNGILVSTNNAVPPYDSGNRVRIGTHGVASFLGGKINEVRVWNVVRTQAEIQANLFTYITNMTGLSAYYRFDQGNAGADNSGLPNEAIDYTGNCNKGALTNFAFIGVTSNWVYPGNSEAPVLTTTAATSLNGTSATLNANVFSSGESNVTSRGFCYATTPCPTTQNLTEAGSWSGTFTYPLTATGLTTGTTYYARAFSTNMQGTSYGEEISFVIPIATITSATYDASSGTLVVTGTDFAAFAGAANDIDVSKLSFNGEGGTTYTLTTSSVEIFSATSFSVTLNGTDLAAVNMMMNKNGISSTGGTTYNLAAAEDWNAGVSVAATIADLTGNGITVSNVATPAITSATFDVVSGVLAVTGAGFLKLSGAANDIDVSKITLTGDGGGSYTLTTASVEISSGTIFSVTLNALDLAAVDLILNKNGVSSVNTTTYNLAAAENWAAGADAAVAVADLTLNEITVSNVPDAPVATAATIIAPTSFSANWNVSTGSAGYRLDVVTDAAFTSFVAGYSNLDVANVTSYSVSGLNTGTNYYYRVRGYNGNSTSINSNTITLITIPAAPVATAATSITTTSFSSNWNASTGVSGYFLDVATDVGFTSFVAGYNNLDIANVTTYAVSGLSPGTNYYYRVRAYNAGGTSSSSNTITIITIPSAPVATAATSITTTGFSSNWNASIGASGYRLDVATDVGFTSFVAGYNNLDVANVTTYAVSGLSPGTNYYYRVRAYNASGTSTNTNTITLITIPPALVATAATSITTTTFSSNWNASIGASGYRLDVATDAGFTSYVTGYNDLDVVNVTTYVVSGLSSGTDYYYRVRAYNAGGTSSNSNTITFITLPAAPLATAATAVSTTIFTANWNASTGAAGYRLDVATNAGFTVFVAGFNDINVSNVTTYAITGLSAITTYYYRIRAYNASGTSVNSNTILQLTAPVAPVAIAATNIISTSFSANWNASAGATGYLLDVATDAVFTSFVPGYNNLNVNNVTTYSVVTATCGNTYYYRVRAYNGGGGISASSNTINFTHVIPAITGTTPGKRAGVGAVMLQATASAGSINWYSAATGGTSLHTGLTFITPYLYPASTYYYIDATSTSGCTTLARTPILATANIITFDVIPSKYVTDVPFTLNATANSGLPITYSVTSGGTVATVSGNTVTLTGIEGQVTIMATQAGNANFAVSNLPRIFTVSKLANIVSLSAITPKQTLDPDFTVVATTPNGTAGFTSSNTAVATVNPVSGLVHIVGAGTTSIIATVPTSAVYLACSASKTLTVSKRTNIIIFNAIPPKHMMDPDFTVTATAVNGIISYSSSNTAVATINASGLIHIVGAGSTTIKASVPVSANYLAGSASQVFTVSKLTNTVTLSTIPAKHVLDPDFSVTATATNGTIVYTSSNVAVATIDVSGLIHIVGAGSTIIKASVPASVNYLAGSAQRTLTVSKINQTITWSVVGSKTTTSPDFPVTATASSGLGTTIIVVSGPATISGGTVHLTGTTGTVKLKATQAGNFAYNVVNSYLTFTVTQAPIANGPSNDNVAETSRFTDIPDHNSDDIIQMIIYPNPSVDGIFNVELSGNNQMESSIKVFDAIGRVAFEQKYNTNKFIVDLSYHSIGIYSIMLNSENKNVLKRIVITK